MQSLEMNNAKQQFNKLRQLLTQAGYITKKPTAKQQAKTKKILDFVRKNNC